MNTINKVPYHLIVKKVNDVQERKIAFEKWKNRNYSKLSKSYHSYVVEIGYITFPEYCWKFFNGTLEDVRKKSYYNCLQ